MIERGKIVSKHSILATGVATLALMSTQAYAQDGEMQESAVQDDGYAPIVVTAQRRAESLQEVPVSVEVFSSEEIRTENLTSLVSLARENPTVKVQGSGRSSNFYIRGTGSGESQAFDQSVGTFIDDVYHGRSRYSQAAFLDLERVEILKGPQSIFFGNNAIAGAINIVTAKPERDFGGWLRVLAAPDWDDSSEQYAMEGAVNLPLSDTLAMRVAGTINGESGWLTNVNTGRTAPNIQNLAGRVTLRWEPSAELDVTLKGEAGESINKGGLVLRQTQCPPVDPYAPAGFCALNLSMDAPSGLKNSLYTANAGNLATLKNEEALLEANYDLGGDHVLTSTTGYYGYRYLLNLDNDGTALELLNVQAPERFKQFSQEVRLTSPSGGDLEYQLGLYFQKDRLDIDQDVSFFFLTGNLASKAVFAPLLPYAPIAQSVRARQDGTTYSAFASATYNLTERLALTAGLRGTIVKKDFDWGLQLGTATQSYGAVVPMPDNLQDLAGNIGIGAPGSVSLKRSDEALMPSASIEYEIDDDVNLYASYSRGFKAGGFSVAELSGDPDNYPFEPEFVDAYEIGVKSELFDRMLTLNLTAFQNDFSDLQVVINGTNSAGAPVNFVRNAASSRARGIELEAVARLSDYFKLSANGTYLDSKYRNYKDAGATYAQQQAAIDNGDDPKAATQDLSGKQTLYAPKWSGSVTGTVTVPVASETNLIAQATGIFSSSYNTIFTLDPLARQDGYARLDARISLELMDGQLAFDVIGKNLTNTTILTFSGYQPNSFGSFFQDREQYRSIAFQGRFAF